jgi:hypothetical protein
MNRYALNDRVVYEGRTYRFPGTVCGITDDGQVIVRATGAPNGDYAGMKHIYAPNQLRRDGGSAALPGRGPAALALATAEAGARGGIAVKAGSRYRQRDGIVAGPVQVNTGPNAGDYPFAVAGGYEDYRFYTADGRCPVWESEAYDLIEEIPAGGTSHG